MVTNKNLNGAIKLAKVAKKLADKRTMTFVEMTDTLRDMVEQDSKYIFDMTTRHDGASIYFFDADKPSYQYEITIYPDYEVLLTICDMNDKVGYSARTVCMMEF